jgi:hypothetical protein
MECVVCGVEVEPTTENPTVSMVDHFVEEHDLGE